MNTRDYQSAPDEHEARFVSREAGAVRPRQPVPGEYERQTMAPPCPPLQPKPETLLDREQRRVDAMRDTATRITRRLDDMILRVWGPQPENAEDCAYPVGDGQIGQLAVSGMILADTLNGIEARVDKLEGLV